MKVASYTDFISNSQSYMDSVIEDSNTVIISHRNGLGAVIMSIDEYNSLFETVSVMSSPETVRQIKEGIEDINAGRCTAQNKGESMSDFLTRMACTE